MTERVIGLKDAVPYLRMYKGKVFVVKVGGGVLTDPEVMDGFAEQVGLLHQLNIDVVVVHGGGPQVNDLSSRLGLPVEQVNGRRITNAETLEVVKMIFNGKVNTDMLAAFRKHDVPSAGISGVDGGLIQAVRRPISPVTDAESGETRNVDFGFVGDVVEVDVGILQHLLSGDFVPVVSALAAGDDGVVYNVNADTIAARLGAALGAEKLIFMTDVPGVLRDRNDPTSLISHMSLDTLQRALDSGVTGGMRAKLETSRDALIRGVKRVHIISALKQDSLVVEIFTNEGSGTLIEQEDAVDAPVAVR